MKVRGECGRRVPEEWGDDKRWEMHKIKYIICIDKIVKVLLKKLQKRKPIVLKSVDVQGLPGGGTDPVSSLNLTSWYKRCS